MAKILFGSIGIFVLFVVFLLAVASGQDGAAKIEYARGQAASQIILASGQAEAMSIRAQAESALAHAQASQANALAFGIMMVSLTPWAILFTVSMLGFAVLGLLGYLGYLRHTQVQQPMPQIVYLPRPDLPRREVWKALEEGRKDIVVLGRTYAEKNPSWREK